MGFTRSLMRVGRPHTSSSLSSQGLRVAWLHVGSVCGLKWEHQFVSKVYGFMDATSRRQRHAEYVKRQARAADKRSLRQWRHVEICASFRERARSASESGKEKFKARWRNPGQTASGSTDGSTKDTCGSGSRSSYSDENGETQGGRGPSFGSERQTIDQTVGLASDRAMLGLSPIGSLTLQELKDAFRQSALKWHPDRHEGDTKVVAEVKFKQIGTAYETLLSILMSN